LDDKLDGDTVVAEIDNFLLIKGRVVPNKNEELEEGIRKELRDFVKDAYRRNIDINEFSNMGELLSKLC